jgi:hypothetical protein
MPNKDKVNNEKQHPKKVAMIEALKNSLGIVTSACETVGIDRTTHYRWLKDDEEYRIATEDIDNISLDFVESQLFKQIRDGNTTATIFYLKTKGAVRGYIEKREYDIKSSDGSMSPRTLNDWYDKPDTDTQ